MRPGDPFFLKALKKRDGEARKTSTAVILRVTPMSAFALEKLKGNLPAPFDNPVVKYESFATVGEIRVYWRADFQSGSRVLKKVF